MIYEVMQPIPTTHSTTKTDQDFAEGTAANQEQDRVGEVQGATEPLAIAPTGTKNRALGKIPRTT